MKNVHYEFILQSLTEDMLRQDAKIKNLQRRYDELKAVHKAISECVDLVNQIYDFCKERNLKLSMDFVNDRKYPEIFIWDSVGDSAICRVVYTSDWITTLKTILSRLKGGYKMCAEAKDDCTAEIK